MPATHIRENVRADSTKLSSDLHIGALTQTTTIMIIKQKEILRLGASISIMDATY